MRGLTCAHTAKMNLSMAGNGDPPVMVSLDTPLASSLLLAALEERTGTAPACFPGPCKARRRQRDHTIFFMILVRSITLSKHFK